MQIQLSKKGDVFSTRPKAHEVFDDLSGEDEIILDFSGVESATPSFLHETILIFRNKNIHIKIENMNSSLQFQLKKARSALH